MKFTLINISSLQCCKNKSCENCPMNKSVDGKRKLCEIVGNPATYLITENARKNSPLHIFLNYFIRLA